MVSRAALLSGDPALGRHWSTRTVRALARTRAQSLAARRTVAAFADLLVCALLLVAANAILSALVGAVPGGAEAPVAALATVLLIATPLVYLVVGESRNRQTVGKRLAGLAVAGENGEPLPYRAAAERLVVRVSPVTWAAVARASLRSRSGRVVASPYGVWTRSVVIDLHGTAPHGTDLHRTDFQRTDLQRVDLRGTAAQTPQRALDRSPELLARSAATLCRCDQLRRLEGADAERYAVNHLVALARFPRHGRASLFCQDTATAWLAQEDTVGEGEFRLHRVAQLPPVIPPR